MSDTPFTDSCTYGFTDEDGIHCESVHADIARTLERERNALSFEVARLKCQRTETETALKKCRKDLEELNHRAEIDAKINKNFIDQLIDMRIERDEAQKACVKWVKIALREASINGSRICGKEAAK